MEGCKAQDAYRRVMGGRGPPSHFLHTVSGIPGLSLRLIAAQSPQAMPFSPTACPVITTTVVRHSLTNHPALFFNLTLAAGPSSGDRCCLQVLSGKRAPLPIQSDTSSVTQRALAATSVASLWLQTTQFSLGLTHFWPSEFFQLSPELINGSMMN